MKRKLRKTLIRQFEEFIDRLDSQDKTKFSVFKTDLNETVVGKMITDGKCITSIAYIEGNDLLKIQQELSPCDKISVTIHGGAAMELRKLL